MAGRSEVPAQEQTFTPAGRIDYRHAALLVGMKCPDDLPETGTGGDG